LRGNWEQLSRSHSNRSCAASCCAARSRWALRAGLGRVAGRARGHQVVGEGRHKGWGGRHHEPAPPRVCRRARGVGRAAAPAPRAVQLRAISPLRALCCSRLA